MPLDRPSHPPNQDLPTRGRASSQLEDTWVTHLRSRKATQALGQAIGRRLVGGEVIALTGELGSGKTILTKGIALGAGISSEAVTSPTFTFIHEYSGQIRLIHADLYRITNPQELRSLGLEDYYDPSTVVIIEWANRMGPAFSQDYLSIHLIHRQRYIRLATLQAHGTQSLALLKRLRTKTLR